MNDSTRPPPPSDSELREVRADAVLEATRVGAPGSLVRRRAEIVLRLVDAELDRRVPARALGWSPEARARAFVADLGSGTLNTARLERWLAGELEEVVGSVVDNLDAAITAYELPGGAVGLRVGPYPLDAVFVEGDAAASSAAARAAVERVRADLRVILTGVGRVASKLAPPLVPVVALLGRAIAAVLPDVEDPEDPASVLAAVERYVQGRARGSLVAAVAPETVVEDLRTLRWSCGLATGPARWQSTEAFEPPECDGEGELVVDVVELGERGERGEPIGNHTHCTRCHQLLEDASHYEVVDEAERKGSVPR